VQDRIAPASPPDNWRNLGTIRSTSDGHDDDLRPASGVIFGGLASIALWGIGIVVLGVLRAVLQLVA
jgi:hypothetical protein